MDEKLTRLLRQLKKIMEDKGSFPGERQRAAAEAKQERPESPAVASTASVTTALVAVKGAAVEVFIKEHYPKLGYRKDSDWVGEGTKDGSRKGRTMELKKGVGGPGDGLEGQTPRLE